MKKRLISIMLAGIMLLTTGCAQIQEMIGKEEEPIEIEFEEEPEPIIVNMIRYDITNTYPFSEGRAWVEWQKPDETTELGLIDENGVVYFRTSDYSWTVDPRYFYQQGGVSWIYASADEPHKIFFVDSEGNVTGQLEGNETQTFDVVCQHNGRFLVQRHNIADNCDEYYIADSTGEQISDFVIDGREFSEIKFEQHNDGFTEVVDGYTGRGYIDFDSLTYVFYRADYHASGYEFVPTVNGLYIKFNRYGADKNTSIGFCPASVLEKLGDYPDENTFYENECAKTEGAFVTPAGTYEAVMTPGGYIFAVSEDRLSVGVYDIAGNTINDYVEVGIRIIDYDADEAEDAVAFGSRNSDDLSYYVTTIGKDGNKYYDIQKIGEYPNAETILMDHGIVSAIDKIVTRDGKVLKIGEDDLSAVGNDVFIGDKSVINYKWYSISGGFVNLKCMKGEERRAGFKKLDGSGSLTFISVEAGEDDDLEAGTQSGMDVEEGETTIIYYDADGNEIGTEPGN